MQSTAPQPKPSDQQGSPTAKKAYHSPSLRAAGSVREETGASADSQRWWQQTYPQLVWEPKGPLAAR